jgi:hypothetical protein
MTQQELTESIFDALVKFQEHQLQSFDDNFGVIMDKVIPKVQEIFEEIDK